MKQSKPKASRKKTASVRSRGASRKRKPARSMKTTATAAKAAAGTKRKRATPGAKRCTLDHVHDASCDFGRKAAGKNPAAGKTRASGHSTIKDPYPTGLAHKLPPYEEERDSDGSHRTGDRS